MAQLRVGPLPEAAAAAAARFYGEIMPGVRDVLASHPPYLSLIFPPAANHTHRSWRLAAVQSLAREYAPVRVNAVSSDSEAAIAAALAYLERAEGVTGQLMQLDDTGAGEVVSSSP